MRSEIVDLRYCNSILICVAPECFTEFVRPSWNIRNNSFSRVSGSCETTPETRKAISAWCSLIAWDLTFSMALGKSDCSNCCGRRFWINRRASTVVLFARSRTAVICCSSTCGEPWINCLQASDKTEIEARLWATVSWISLAMRVRSATTVNKRVSILFRTVRKR